MDKRQSKNSSGNYLFPCIFHPCIFIGQIGCEQLGIAQVNDIIATDDAEHDNSESMDDDFPNPHSPCFAHQAKGHRLNGIDAPSRMALCKWLNGIENFVYSARTISEHVLLTILTVNM